MNREHPTLDMCWRGSERKRWKLVVAETEEHMGRVFSEYGMTLISVTSFKYLGRILLSPDDDWPLAEQNIRQAQGKWEKMVNILGSEGADKRTAGIFYVAVVQAVILFWSETWVLTHFQENSLSGFHHQAVQRKSGMGPKRQWYGTWMYPPIGAALEMVGLNDIGVYISHQYNTVTQYIATHAIMDLCLEAERRPGM